MPNKCASQYLNQLTFKLLGLTELKPGTKWYSYRSSVAAAQSRFKPDDVKAMCQTGEKVLFVRHPVLRLISAWNDKFSLANRQKANGLYYGMGVLRRWAKKTKILKADVAFMNAELAKVRKANKSCNDKAIRKTSGCLELPSRPQKRNPDHLIDFYDLLVYLKVVDPVNIDPHFG